MSFVSLDFAVLFPVVFLVSWILRQWPGPWRVWLAVASAAFYASWSPAFLLVLVGLGLTNHLIALAIEHLGRLRTGATRAMLGLAVVANVGAVVAFRHYGSFVDDLVDLAFRLGFVLSAPAASTIAPLGISFFTLTGLGYVIDVYRGDLAPLRPLDAAVHLTYFPAIVAGPLVRADELVPELRRVHDQPRIDLARVLRLLAGGALKLIAIAPFIGTRLVDPVFADPGAHGGLTILVAVYALAFQIYATFSGIIDMATGISELLGIRLPTSFNAPYLATSVSDFWLRWNMTVTRWFRDYVYNSFGGDRRGALRTAPNLMIAALLLAVWFEPKTTFVVWGAIHGALLIVEHWLAPLVARIPGSGRIDRRIVAVPRWLYTFHAVCLAWIPFRADSLDNARAVVGGLATPDTLAVLSLSAAIIVAGMFLAHAAPPERVTAVVANLARPGPAFQGMVFAVAVTLALAFAPSLARPFPYLGL